ncbi:MAG TPA: acyl-CoA thioesterase [Treponema sp.]|nr:acyl-CoA thioesterase [Treponema sp.]
METYTTVMTEHLNSHGTLFGGQLLMWVDKNAWMAASLDFPGKRLVTRAMDCIDFTATAPNGSILRFVIEKEHLGNTSVTYSVKVYCNVPGDPSSLPRQKGEYKIFENRITFVAVDDNGKKVPLGN